MFTYKSGIEFEYILLDEKGAVLDFTNIDSDAFLPIIDAGRDEQTDEHLSTGDLGIKKGFWYPEGDERFDENGNFTGIKVKGIEIRTPAKDSIQDSVATLLKIEDDLTNILSPYGMHLGIIGYNPVTPEYTFVPELNEWEKNMRDQHKEYAYADISNLSYGPDINLSSPAWDEATSIDIAEKLNYYSPYMVPFSFSSPFYANSLWDGYSKRTYERTWRRPAVRVFTAEDLNTPPTWKASKPSEQGRIEFKSYDAIVSKELLATLAALTLGVALSDLPERSQVPSKEMHQLAAKQAFGSDEIYNGAKLVYQKALQALTDNHLTDEATNLKFLEAMLNEKRTPSDDYIDEYGITGKIKVKDRLNK